MKRLFLLLLLVPPALAAQDLDKPSWHVQAANIDPNRDGKGADGKHSFTNVATADAYARNAADNAFTNGVAQILEMPYPQSAGPEKKTFVVKKS